MTWILSFWAATLAWLVWTPGHSIQLNKMITERKGYYSKCRNKNNKYLQQQRWVKNITVCMKQKTKLPKTSSTISRYNSIHYGLSPNGAQRRRIIIDSNKENHIRICLSESCEQYPHIVTWFFLADGNEDGLSQVF